MVVITSKCGISKLFVLFNGQQIRLVVANGGVVTTESSEVTSLRR